MGLSPGMLFSGSFFDIKPLSCLRCSLSLVGSQVDPLGISRVSSLDFFGIGLEMYRPYDPNVSECVELCFDFLNTRKHVNLDVKYIYIYHIPIKEEFQTFQIPNIAFALHMYCFLPVVPQKLVSLRVCHGFAKHRAGECADTRANWILVSGLKSSLFGTENTVLAVVFLDVQDQGRNVQNKSRHTGVKNVRCFWYFESWVTNERLD